MKFIITKKNFLKPIQKLNNILTTNSEHPIINNIMCCIEDNNTYLMSTNLELELIAKIHCDKIFSIGKILVSGKKILNIVRSFPNNSEIHITVRNNNMTLQYKKIYFLLNTLNAKHFPKFQTKKTTYNIEINQNKFKNMIYSTHYAMAKQDVRHYLNGMNIEVENNKIFAIATDGYRMALTYIKYCSNQNISIIIPYKTILELIKTLEHTDDTFIIHITKKSIQFSLKNYIISSKLIDNQFPKCKNLIIKKFDKTIILNKEKFKKSLTRASILIHQKLKGVRIIIHNGLCTVSASNEYDETIKEEFKINYFNAPIELTMNIHYILDVINIIESDMIHILLNDNSSAIYIKCADLNHIYHIIMPLVL